MSGDEMPRAVTPSTVAIRVIQRLASVRDLLSVQAGNVPELRIAHTDLGIVVSRLRAFVERNGSVVPIVEVRDVTSDAHALEDARRIIQRLVAGAMTPGPVERDAKEWLATEGRVSELRAARAPPGPVRQPGSPSLEQQLIDGMAIAAIQDLDKRLLALTARVRSLEVDAGHD